MKRKLFLISVTAMLLWMYAGTIPAWVAGARESVPRFQSSGSQALGLKAGFNFAAFTLKPSITPAGLKAQFSFIDEIYSFNAASGSFLSSSDAAFAAFEAGNGYIIKAKEAASINVEGAGVSSVGGIALKKGFNLVGISRSVESLTFGGLMTSSPSVKGIYKFNADSGSFIQVVKNSSGAAEPIDGFDPVFAAGQSYFMDMENDGTLDYDTGKITISAAAIVLSSIALNKSSDSVSISSNYDLSAVTATAWYSDSTSRAVLPVWTVKSGGGAISGTVYTAPATVVNAVLTASYTEGAITKTAELALAVSGPAVSAPAFNLPDGTTFTSTLYSVISTASAGAAIKYTMDGSAPSDTNGVTFAAGSILTLTSTVTIKAIAIENGWTSEVASVTYTKIIETNPPASAITVDLGGGISLEMVKIPAAGNSFQMGNPDASKGSYEWPVHTVYFNRDYYIGKYETTQAQWLKISSSWPGATPSAYGSGDNYPAYYVSWDDICGKNGFIDKINALAPSGYKNFRLPTEAEWEYAARSGTQTRYYWGEDPSYLLIDGYAWYGGNSGSKTHPVGAKSSNQFGLYDMSGNVAEWCADYVAWYGSAASVDPTGPASGSDRVNRGGYYDSFNNNVRSSFRGSAVASTRHAGVGFRLVLPIAR